MYWNWACGSGGLLYSGLLAMSKPVHYTIPIVIQKKQDYDADQGMKRELIFIAEEMLSVIKSDHPNFKPEAWPSIIARAKATL